MLLINHTIVHFEDSTRQTTIANSIIQDVTTATTLANIEDITAVKWTTAEVTTQPLAFAADTTIATESGTHNNIPNDLYAHCPVFHVP